MPNITKLSHEKLLAAIDSARADARLARDVADHYKTRAETMDHEVVALREENIKLTRAHSHVVENLKAALSKVAARDEGLVQLSLRLAAYGDPKGA